MIKCKYKNCNKQFIQKSKDQEYCSTRCWELANHMNINDMLKHPERYDKNGKLKPQYYHLNKKFVHNFKKSRIY